MRYMKQSKPLWYLIHNCRSNRGGIIFLTLLQIFLGFSGVLIALLMRNTIDYAVAGNIKQFRIHAELLVLFTLLQIMGSILVRYVGESCRSRIENELKGRLFSVLISRQYAEVTYVHSGEWMNRLTSDTKIAADGVVDIFPSVIGLIVRLAAALTAILTLEYRFSYILIPGGLIVFLFSSLLRKRLKQMHKDVQTADGSLRVMLQEHLSSLMMVKAFSVENYAYEVAKKKMNDHRSVRMKRTLFSIFTNTGLSMIMIGAYLLGFLYCGFGLLDASISYGTMIALLQLISQVQAPFSSLSGYIPRYYAMIASIERLMEPENFQKEERKDKDNLLETQTFSKICLQEISFSYPGVDQDVLENITFTIHNGDSIALTGPSGSGKSTLFRLLLNLLTPDSGRITVMDSKGQHSLKIQDRCLFAYVPQGNQLMNGTIREVVCFYLPYEEDKMKAALCCACADDFVSKLPNGIDTVLGERGAGLSEGQMQRLSIARALYSGAPILLLDEATSALDESTEQKLLENLNRLTNHTVLIVTHRPAALSICNRQISLSDASDNMKFTESSSMS